MKATLNPVVHELAGALRWVGLRDRLRCPECSKIGTFKPHGTLWDRWRHSDRKVRRWLCKWCGFYVGPEGRIYAFPSTVTRAWALPGWDKDGNPAMGDGALDVEPVPSAVIRNHYGRPVNPWAG